MTTLVIGGTGNVGSAAVLELLRRGAPVRVLTRDRAGARHVLGDGPEIVVADLGDPRSVHDAFRGVRRVFLGMANHPGQVAAECAAIDAARALSVDRVVKLSGPAPDHASPLFAERWHARIEDHLTAAGLPSVVLRPASFMTNLLGFAEPVGRAGILPAPAEGARVAFVDPRDVGSVAATVLLADTAPPARAVRVTGPAAASYAEVAATMSAVLDRPVAFVPVTDADARASMLGAGLPEFMADAFLAVYRMQREGALSAVAGTVPALLGRPARSVADFVADHRGSFAAAGVAAR